MRLMRFRKALPRDIVDDDSMHESELMENNPAAMRNARFYVSLNIANTSITMTCYIYIGRPYCTSYTWEDTPSINKKLFHICHPSLDMNAGVC